MAINQNTTHDDSSSLQGGSASSSDSAHTLWKLLEHLLESIKNGNLSRPSEEEYQKICEYIVVLLAADQRDSIRKNNIRNVRLLADAITKQLQQLVEQKAYRELVKDCLEKLYAADALSSQKFPSPFTTIMLALMEPKQGAAWICSKNVSDDHIKKILTVFIDWLCTINFAPNLNVWIVQMVEGLLTKGKTNCVLNLRKEKLKQCKELMLLPHYQQQLAPVISCLESVEDLQPLDDGRLDYNYAESYDGSLETDASLIRSNARVGLVNLGNTCYMNSVVQALAMTKQFCTEVLMKQIDAPPFSEIQQLLALLIHSRRPELTPRAVLATTRPPGFAPGYQQDSSEFLSYLLDRLHEQEKKLLLVGSGDGGGGAAGSSSKTLVVFIPKKNKLINSFFYFKLSF